MTIGSQRQLQMTVTTSSGKPLSAPSPSSTEQSVVAARGADGPTRSGCCGCEPAQTGPRTVPSLVGRSADKWKLSGEVTVCTSWLQWGVLLLLLAEESRRPGEETVIRLGRQSLPSGDWHGGNPSPDSHLLPKSRLGHWR